MNPLRFFIVFHDSIPHTHNDFSNEEKCAMLRWIAVNEKIPKKIPSEIPSECIMYEWKLKLHNPFLQMNNMKENSVIHHFYNNPEMYDGAKYIGLGQYDMILDACKFRALQSSLVSNNQSIGFFPFTYNFGHLFDPYPPEFWSKFFIDSYNAYANKSHTLQTLGSRGFIPLINCFIIPVEIWKRMVEFSIFITPIILRGLNWDYKHLGGTMERVHGLFLLCCIAENKFDAIMDFPAITHH